MAPTLGGTCNHMFCDEDCGVVLIGGSRAGRGRKGFYQGATREQTIRNAITMAPDGATLKVDTRESYDFAVKLHRNACPGKSLNIVLETEVSAGARKFAGMMYGSCGRGEERLPEDRGW